MPLFDLQGKLVRHRVVKWCKLHFGHVAFWVRSPCGSVVFQLLPMGRIPSLYFDVSFWSFCEYVLTSKLWLRDAAKSSQPCHSADRFRVHQAENSDCIEIAQGQQLPGLLCAGRHEVPGHGARAQAQPQEPHAGGLAHRRLLLPPPRVDAHGAPLKFRVQSL